ncbi:MAG TPA: DUF4179 domain-containing protein, partial [Clostridiaceae bacterium]|nr:DUF4179 domain-containing protein [Clostridiaceae bacterium]
EAFLSESSDYPEGLAEVERRLDRRIMKEKRKKRALYSSLGTVAASLAFVLLVNTSTAFANSVSRIPVLSELADFVKLDKGLSSAIENDYVQEVGLTAWDGEKTLMLPYVLADERNLILFFQLPKDFKLDEEEWIMVDTKKMTDTATGEEIRDGFSYGTGGMQEQSLEESSGYLMQRYNFIERKLPQAITMEVELRVSRYEQTEEQVTGGEEGTHTWRSGGTYSFQIDFNAFKEPVIYPVNQEHTLKGQKVTVKEMTVYPTGTEVSFEFPEQSAAWVRGLDIALEQDGKEMENTSGMISSIYDDEKGTRSIFIDSNYFEKPKRQALLLKGLRILEKDLEFINVDLETRIITPAIEGLELKEVVRKGDKADLVFSTKLESEEGFGIFDFEYKDVEGNTYRLNSEGMTTPSQLIMETMITVAYPESGKLIFKRVLTPMQKLEEPIRIVLPEKR